MPILDAQSDMIIKAIRERDETTLNKFYSFYKIEPSHPVHVLFDKLIEELEIKVIDDGLNNRAYNFHNQAIGEIKDGKFIEYSDN